MRFEQNELTLALQKIHDTLIPSLRGRFMYELREKLRFDMIQSLCMIKRGRDVREIKVYIKGKEMYEVYEIEIEDKTLNINKITKQIKRAKRHYGQTDI